MKKLFILSLLLISAKIYAEVCYAEHALMVHRLSCWAPEYLTVTNNWNNMFFTNAPSTLKTLSVITEINGQSTKDIEPDDFYAIIDKTNHFTITYMSKIRGENKIYTQQLNKKNGILPFCDESTNGWADKDDERWYYWHKDEEEYFEEEWNPWGQHFETKRHTRRVGQTPKESTTLMSDQNADFFNYCTFDYMVAGDDYMIDLGLVQALAKELERKGLKYNPEKPDIYIYLTKDANTSIESIYTPNIISTTHSSSNTTGNVHIYYGNYNTWGRVTSRTNSSSTTNTRDVGQAKVVVDADLYLQVSILDASKMDNTNPPVVWQLIHNKHFKNETNILEWIKRLHCGVYYYPLSTQAIGRRIESWGIFFTGSLSTTGVVSDLVDGGWGERNNVKVGNVLKKIKNGKSSFVPGKGRELGWAYGTHDLWVDQIIFDKCKINSFHYKDFEVPYFFIPEKELE